MACLSVWHIVREKDTLGFLHLRVKDLTHNIWRKEGAQRPHWFKSLISKSLIQLEEASKEFG